MAGVVRVTMLAAVVMGGVLAGSGGASAQNLNDLGRVLQDQVLGGRQNPNQDRDAYERGRRDQADQAQRERDDHRRFEEQRGRPEDRRRFEEDRRRQDEDRRRQDEDRARDQPRRY